MYKCIKSVADVFFALIALAITAPLMLVCAIIVRCDGRGKALFRQERIGKGGKTFFIYKFRTMTATDIAFATDHAVIEDGNPSVTKAGRILRKFKLDELPQLFNVLKGEMSFVGPRPLMPVYLDEYEEWEKQKFAVKPGLTGLAQVNGNGYLEKKSRSYYDVFYVENESLFLDVKIFFKTFLIVLFGEEKFLREVDEKEIKEAEIRFDSRKTEEKSRVQRFGRREFRYLSRRKRGDSGSERGRKKHAAENNIGHNTAHERQHNGKRYDGTDAQYRRGFRR